MNTCPTCGRPFTSGEKLCQKCGTILPKYDPQSADPSATAPYANLCPACGRMFTPGDRYCRQCGSELPEMSPVPVSVPSMPH
ncbi:MAG: zinc ribbon domain-containing protein [Lachnospiraceae bacterium]|nr:zinc ribbon domain-containing protein [Lachnospiraceae bacterium]